jgi:mRNA interferase MazF
VQNIITIPHEKLLRKLGNITPEQMVELEQVLLFWLGFDEENVQDDDE